VCVDLLPSTWNDAAVNMAFYGHFENGIITEETTQVNLQIQDVDCANKNLNKWRHTDRFRVMYIITQSLPFFF